MVCVMFLSACQKEENRKYVHWGEITENDKKRLTENGIDFKVKNENLYIPEDQMKKAVACCT